MNALFTVYVEVEYDSTNEGDYKRRVYSVDCKKDDLIFTALLPSAGLIGNGDKIIQVAIHTPGSIARIPPTEHFESVDELIAYFGSIHFKRKD